ncbi:MAG: hypothetical protein HN727_13170 [Opitutae bacterium]|nr:hypothetical protein [Opitutae bacterium]
MSKFDDAMWQMANISRHHSAWRSSQKQTEELEKQSKLLSKQKKLLEGQAKSAELQADAEMARLEIEKQRLDIEKREMANKREIDSQIKDLRKQMTRLSHQLDGISTSLPANIRQARELGLIQAQLDLVKQLDAFSELADLEYLAELEAKVAHVAEKLTAAGKSPKALLALLKTHLGRLHTFTTDFYAKVKAFRDGCALPPTFSKFELEERLSLLGSLWRGFENDLSSVDINFEEEDWQEDESTEGKVFCTILQSYDHFKNGDSPPQLALSQDLKSYVDDPAKFKQSCLGDLHQTKEEIEQLLVKREQTLNLLYRAKREFQRGDAEMTKKLFEEIPNHHFGLFDINDADLKESLSLLKQLDSELSILRERVARPEAMRIHYSWNTLASSFHDFKDRASVLPKPIIEAFNLTELENTISSGLAKAFEAKAKADKRQRARRRAVLLARRRAVLFVAAIPFIYIFVFICYRCSSG